MVTDPIADLLTRIRNAGLARHKSVILPMTKMSLRIVQILDSENYIDSYVEYTEKTPIRVSNGTEEEQEGGYRTLFQSVLQKKINSKNLFFSNTRSLIRESLDITDGSDVRRWLLPPCINTNNLRGGLLVFLSYVEPGPHVRRSKYRKFPLIDEITRISKASYRVYWRASKGLPRVQGGLGLAVLSTTEGIITDAEARAKGVGGEVLFTATKRR
jgi:ribosomal protein S8